MALDDQVRRRGTGSSSSGWSSTRPASRSRPASSRSSRPTRSCSRSARRPTSRCSTACPGSTSTTASSSVDAGMMTGHPGVFAGGDMTPRASARSRSRSATASRRRAAIDAWLRGSERATAPKHELAPFDALNTWYYDDAPRTVQPQLELARRAVDVRRGRRRPRRDDRALRGAPLPLLRQLLLVRQLLRRLPRQRRDQARRARPSRTRSTTTTARAAASASPSARAARSSSCPETI